MIKGYQARVKIVITSYQTAVKIVISDCDEVHIKHSKHSREALEDQVAGLDFKKVKPEPEEFEDIMNFNKMAF